MFKVGDMVTPSSKVKNYHWWPSYKYLWGMEFMVIKVEKGVSISENIVHFHDPRHGTRKWRASSFNLVSFSLENE